MKRYRVTPAATADLEGITAFLARQCPPEITLRVLMRVRAEIKRAARNPGIGRARTDLADETLRVWSAHSYLILYRPGTRPVEIVRVIHGARDLARAMRL